MNYTNRNNLNYFDFYRYHDRITDTDPLPEYELITDSSVLCLSVEEVLEHLKIEQDQAEGNLYLEMLIKAAERCAEDLTRRSFINKTYRTHRESFGSFIELRRSKYQSISAFKYWSEETDDWVTIDSGVYYVTSSKDYSRIYLKDQQTWPTITTSRKQKIRIDFVAGYGAAASSVPKDLKLAMLHHVAAMYEQRGDWGSADLGNNQLIGCLPTMSRLVYSNYKIANK